MRKFLSVMLLAVILLFAGIADAAMMVQDTGATSILNAYFNNSPAPGNVILHLYCTNVTPADTDTSGSYTECSGGGYSSKTLTNGSWTTSTVSGIPQAAYAAQTFTFTGALTTNTTIYGYYVMNAGGTILLWSELLGSTFTPANNGDSVTITPQFQMTHGTPAD
jgi:hypothetical protein